MVEADIIKIIILITFLGICSYTDIKGKYILVKISIIYGILGIVYGFCFENRGILEILIGIVPGIIVLIISVITKESIGKGDALIILVMGIYTGIVNNLIVFIYALFFTVIVGIILLLIMKKGRKFRIAFAPFIFLGYLVFLII